MKDRSITLRSTAIAALCVPLALQGTALWAADVAGPLFDGTPLAAISTLAQAEAVDVPPAPALLHDPYAVGPAEKIPPLPADPAATAQAARENIEPPPGATESLRDAIVEALKGNPEIQIALARQDDAKYG